MLVETEIITKRLVIKNMREDSCLKQYLKWIRDPCVTKYLETRFKPIKTTEQLKHWIRRINESEDNLILGFNHRNTMTHIGI